MFHFTFLFSYFLLFNSLHSFASYSIFNEMLLNKWQSYCVKVESLYLYPQSNCVFVCKWYILYACMIHISVRMYVCVCVFWKMAGIYARYLILSTTIKFNALPKGRLPFVFFQNKTRCIIFFFFFFLFLHLLLLLLLLYLLLLLLLLLMYVYFRSLGCRLLFPSYFYRDLLCAFFFGDSEWSIC